MKAYCPQCGKSQKCFKDVALYDTIQAYKFVCECLTVVYFAFKKDTHQKPETESRPDWLVKDVEVLKNA
jgi:hypothetical protein